MKTPDKILLDALSKLLDIKGMTPHIYLHLCAAVHKYYSEEVVRISVRLSMTGRAVIYLWHTESYNYTSIFHDCKIEVNIWRGGDLTIYISNMATEDNIGQLKWTNPAELEEEFDDAEVEIWIDEGIDNG